MKELFKALAEFRESVPVIHEATKGYNYTYASLGQIFKVINPLLKKNGLGFTQLLNGNDLKTIIYHIKSGESIESTVTIPQDVKLAGMNPFQVAGSAITYYRRYSISSALGLITDKDIDAGGDQEKVLPTLESGTDAWNNVVTKKIPLVKVKEHYVVSTALSKEYSKAIK